MSAFTTPDALFERLKIAWSKESSDSWSAENPAKGQCSVTSLVVHDLFGGDILKTKTRGGTHFYNSINGVRWDLTISQFDYPIPFEDRSSSRDEAMADTSQDKYDALRSKLGISRPAQKSPSLMPGS
jgi:hypothetical protein